MQLIRHSFIARASTLMLMALFFSGQASALETDRQKPLEVNANSTDGTLGDGVTTLRGDVDIRQGTLHITADMAEVVKADGRVQKVTFRGKPAFLEQQIEAQGLVQATANSIEYQVASGLVTLSGKADVKHPQYQISGDLLTYDLNIQHFKGNGDNNGNGRIHIRLDPEVLDDPNFTKSGKKSGEGKKNNTQDAAKVNPETDKQPANQALDGEQQVAPEFDAPFGEDPDPDDSNSENPNDISIDPDNIDMGSN